MTSKELDNAFVSGKTYLDFTTGHELYKRLRHEDPVHWAEPDGYRPFWIVSKHADIMEVERQHDKFLNAPRQRLLTIDFENRVLEETRGQHQTLTRSLNMCDGDEHRALRNITAQWFTSKHLQTLAPGLEALAKAWVDKLPQDDTQIDLFTDFASWYPLHAILQLLGLPQEDAPLFKELTNSIFGGTDPEMLTAGGAIEATRAFREYFDVVAEQRRAAPREDVASAIANATLDGRPLTPYESSSYYIALATAGHDTTGAVIAGGIYQLMQHPDQWQRLKQSPELLSSAIDEIVRWVSPTKHFFRTAKDDYVLRGKHIKAGDHLMMLYPSGNRDEDVFEAPYEFRIDRKPNKHLGFGFGVHMCLGMMLAKLEIQTLLKELLHRVERFEPAGSPAWIETHWVGGLKRLPVTVVWDARSLSQKS